jgi:hypothetical protein
MGILRIDTAVDLVGPVRAAMAAPAIVAADGDHAARDAHKNRINPAAAPQPTPIHPGAPQKCSCFTRKK